VISHTSRKDFRGACPEGTAKSVIGLDYGSFFSKLPGVLRRPATKSINHDLVNHL
jgi:hypothetical protein